VGKRAWISLPIIIVLLAGIAATVILGNTKIDATNVKDAKRIAAYAEPAVVQVYNYAVINWDFSAVEAFQYYAATEQEYNYLGAINEYFVATEGRSYVGGRGSGAIISSNGYIVTNAHVVDATRKNDDELIAAGLESTAYEIADIYSLDPSLVYAYLVYTLGFTSIQRVQKVVLPSGEAYDSDTKAFGAPIGEGKDVAVIKIDANNLPTLQLGNSDAVELQDDIWVIGYPGAAELRELSEDSQIVSTIAAGQVSAKDKKSEQGSPLIQINAAALPGNSGGPVVDRNGKIIGLLTAGPTEQLNFAVPSSTVQEFVAQSGAKNAPGPVDTLYREGLEFFWAGYYEEALDRFQKVEQLYDKHPKIKQLISESREKMGQNKTYWPKYKTYFYIYDGVAAVIIIFLIIFAFVLKPKQRPQTPEVPESPPEKGTE
jgi:S1-C subfamily serine protease/preprotein translocase subunit SecE